LILTKITISDFMGEKEKKEKMENNKKRKADTVKFNTLGSLIKNSGSIQCHIHEMTLSVPKTLTKTRGENKHWRQQCWREGCVNDLSCPVLHTVNWDKPVSPTREAASSPSCS
jgi:hypothetical protein